MAASTHVCIVTDSNISGTVVGTQTKAEYLQALLKLLEGCVSGERNCAVYGGTDVETPVASAITVACARASATDGDKLNFILPDGQTVVLSVLASGAVAANGQISSASSDTAMASSLVACVQQVGGLNRYFTATSSSGTVTITARQPGAYWNGLLVTKTVTTAGVFTIGGSGSPTNGRDPQDRASGTFTTTQASIANDSTTIVGTVTFTWKTSAPSGENQILIGVGNPASATNLAAAINAHSALRGLVVATVASNVVTLTYWAPGREGELIRTTGTAGVVASGAGLVTTAVGAYYSGPVAFVSGL